MNSKRQEKHLSLSPKGHHRILRNTERFGWECYKNVLYKHKTVEQGYKIEEDDDGFRISSDDKVYQSRVVKLDFERYPDTISKFASVFALECVYNVFYFFRKLSGKLIFIAMIALFISLFNMQSNNMYNFSLKLALISLSVPLVYIISRVLENILSRIAEGLLD